MGKITNSTRKDVTLPTRHVIPANGSLDVSDELVRVPDNWPSISGRLVSGELAWTPDETGEDVPEVPEPAPQVEPSQVIRPRLVRQRASKATDPTPEPEPTPEASPAAEPAPEPEQKDA